ncbi:SRPBCC family protein [Halobacillus salinarum]|nr:SRPBCC family protein [Halobacillus salinarum]
MSVWINVPVEECFDLARNIGLHPFTVPQTKEKPIAGRREGLIEAGEMVTWRARHLGVTQTLTSLIQSMNRPYQFVDVMVKGAFRSFTHVHLFEQKGEGTKMIDILQFESPFGHIGKLADKLFLERYMRKFLTIRAVNLKRIGESLKP